MKMIVSVSESDNNYKQFKPAKALSNERLTQQNCQLYSLVLKQRHVLRESNYCTYRSTQYYLFRVKTNCHLFALQKLQIVPNKSCG